MKDSARFDEIAVALFEVARIEAWGVAGCEHLTASTGSQPGMTMAMNALRRRADLVGLAHVYFRAMCPMEIEIKAMIERGQAA
jgi:hypothetical protein